MALSKQGDKRFQAVYEEWSKAGALAVLEDTETGIRHLETVHGITPLLGRDGTPSRA